jgi:hypothetical protein
LVLVQMQLRVSGAVLCPILVPKCELIDKQVLTSRGTGNSRGMASQALTELDWARTAVEASLGGKPGSCKNMLAAYQIRYARQMDSP